MRFVSEAKENVDQVIATKHKDLDEYFDVEMPETGAEIRDKRTYGTMLLAEALKIFMYRCSDM